LGHFTRALVATGATVVAVERDRELVAVLQAEGLPGARLVEGNAAELDFAAAAGANDVVVVGNLPYHLTSPILFSVLDQAAHVKRAVFTLQKEVVDRVSAAPGSRTYGLLSVLLGQVFHVEHVFDIDRHAFHPPPNVDSAVLRLARRSVPKGPVADQARFRRLVKAGFAQRRKTLNNSLASDATLFEQVAVSKVLVRAGIDGKRRAETLSVDEFVLLEQALAALTTAS
jgi:16S rRNA (adenine1518-N6/adenine1519-N6)-dimethyltransferase